MRSRTITIAAALAALVALPVSARADTGVASFYGFRTGKHGGYYGRQTANGDRFNPLGMTAAHRTLPFGTRLLVTYRGRSVSVRVNDRGPFVRGRVLDLAYGAARAIGLVQAGHGVVTYVRQ